MTSRPLFLYIGEIHFKKRCSARIPRLELAKLPAIVKQVLSITTGMGQKEWRPSNVLDVFADPVAHITLVLAYEQPVAVKELTDMLDVFAPTIYRRINPLVSANLLKEHQRIDPDSDQNKEYETILDQVTVGIKNDGYTVDIQDDRDLTDDFEAMWADIESTSHRLDVAQQLNPSRDGNQGGDPM